MRKRVNPDDYYVLLSVVDVKTNQPKTSGVHEDIVGRGFSIQPLPVTGGIRMEMVDEAPYAYGVLRTSKVVKQSVKGNVYIFTTLNSIYTFKKQKRRKEGDK